MNQKQKILAAKLNEELVNTKLRDKLNTTVVKQDANAPQSGFDNFKASASELNENSITK